MQSSEEQKLFLKLKASRGLETESKYVVANRPWTMADSPRSRGSSWRGGMVKMRLKEEWWLYSRHMRGLVIWTNLCVMWYFSFGILQNIAYLRQRQLDTLKDLAFEMIDESFHQTKTIVETCFFLVTGLLAMASLLGNLIYQPPHMQRVFNINIITKGVCCYHWGIFLRSLVFVATSIPDASSECHPMQDKSYWDRKPQTLEECFSFIDFSHTLCGGDLLFAGNLFAMFFIVHYLSEATRSIFGWYPRAHKRLFWGLYLVVIWECFATVAARKHYLVEVVMSSMFSNLYLPYFDAKWQFDVDPNVDLDKKMSGLVDKKRDEVVKRKPTCSFYILNYWYSCIYSHFAITVAELFVIWGVLAPRGAARWKS